MDSYVVTYTVWKGNKPHTREIEVETPHELWTSVFGTSYHKVDICLPKNKGKPGDYTRKAISAFSDDSTKFAAEVDRLLADHVGVSISRRHPSERMVAQAHREVLAALSGVQDTQQH